MRRMINNANLVEKISAKNNELYYANRPLKIDSIRTSIIKDFNETTGGPQNKYVGFASGVMFNGKEYHCVRAGESHVVGASTRVVFYIVDEQGNIEEYIVPLDYNALKGDIRDPQLSVSRKPDEEHLILTFALHKGNSKYDNYCVVFTPDLGIEKMTKLLTSENEFTWSHVLGTPTGWYLLTTYDFVAGTVKLYRLSSLRNISSESMKLVKTFKVDCTINEPSIGYVDDSLLLICRTASDGGTYFFTNTDVEGIRDEWQATHIEGLEIHSPQLPISQRGPLAVFTGSKVYNGGKRPPCVAIFDTITRKVIQCDVLNDMNAWSGYPSCVPLGGDTYASVYYEDAEGAGLPKFSSTRVYYQRFKLTRTLLNTNYLYCENTSIRDITDSFDFIKLIGGGNIVKNNNNEFYAKLINNRMVVLSFNIEGNMQISDGASLCTINSIYKPRTTIRTMAATDISKDNGVVRSAINVDFNPSGVLNMYFEDSSLSNTTQTCSGIWNIKYIYFI